jgi:predicted RNase H-like nuclease (RuvC/YqgF family)
MSNGDYGSSANGRVYEQLERAIVRGLDNLQANINRELAEMKGQLADQSKELAEVKRDLAVSQERNRVLERLAEKQENQEGRIEVLERDKAKALGIAAGVSATITGAGAWLVHIFTRGGQ